MVLVIPLLMAVVPTLIGIMAVVLAEAPAPIVAAVPILPDITPQPVLVPSKAVAAVSGLTGEHAPADLVVIPILRLIPVEAVFQAALVLQAPIG